MQSAQSNFKKLQETFNYLTQIKPSPISIVQLTNLQFFFLHELHNSNMSHWCVQANARRTIHRQIKRVQPIIIKTTEKVSLKILCQKKSG